MSNKIDFTTFTFLSSSGTSIQLTAGKWIVIATLNVLTSVDSGNFDSTISWIGKSQLFQGYRVSGQNRNQVSFTFENILEPADTTTYTAARTSGDQVNFYQSHWIAIKLSS